MCYSGGAVSGNLLLSVDEPKSFKRILVQFSGKSHVHWTERRRTNHGHSDQHRSGHHSHTETRSYTSTETYAELEAAVWDSQQSLDGKLAPGQYNWPFSFNIPPNAPSSFEGSVGYIRYSLVGKIVTGLLKFNHSVELRVPVQQLVKISDPRLLQPVRQEDQKTVCCLCCASGPIVLTVALPKTGFCIGESFQLHASLENGSSRQVTITATITQSVTYYAQGGSSHSGKTLVNIESDEIDPQASRDWDPTVQIPTSDVDIFQDSTCRNIVVAHLMIVACQIPGAIDLSVSFPLVLGNCREEQNSAMPAFPPVAVVQPGLPQPTTAAYPPPLTAAYPPPPMPGPSALPYPVVQTAPSANEKTPLLKK